MLLDEADAVVVVEVEVEVEDDVDDPLLVVVETPPVPPAALDPEALAVAPPPVPVTPPETSPSVIPKMALHADRRPPQSASAGMARRASR